MKYTAAVITVSDMGSRGRPYRSTTIEGFEVLVGKGDAENDKLTFGVARPQDFWLHVAGPPGSHVVVMSRGEDIPDTTKQEAAELAVIHSSAYKAGAGAKVAVLDRQVDKAKAVAAEIGGLALECDICDAASVTPLYSARVLA